VLSFVTRSCTCSISPWPLEGVTDIGISKFNDTSFRPFTSSSHKHSMCNCAGVASCADDVPLAGRVGVYVLRRGGLSRGALWTGIKRGERGIVVEGTERRG